MNYHFFFLYSFNFFFTNRCSLCELCRFFKFILIIVMLIVQCIYFSELLFHTYDCFFMKAQEVFKFILFLPNFTFKNEKKTRQGIA